MLITGASGGIGAAVVRAAADRGYRVLAAGRDAASKAGQRELADCLRKEEAHLGLRVTTIYPGGTATQLLQTVRAAFGAPFRPTECIQPGTLASIVLNVLDRRDDAYLPEVSVLPTPRP